jgi:hypothetical protein
MRTLLAVYKTSQLHHRVLGRIIQPIDRDVDGLLRGLVRLLEGRLTNSLTIDIWTDGNEPKDPRVSQRPDPAEEMEDTEENGLLATDFKLHSCHGYPYRQVIWHFDYEAMEKRLKEEGEKIMNGDDSDLEAL